MCLVGEAQRDGMEVRGGWSRVVTDKTWRLLLVLKAHTGNNGIDGSDIDNPLSVHRPPRRAPISSRP